MSLLLELRPGAAQPSVTVGAVAGSVASASRGVGRVLKPLGAAANLVPNPSFEVDATGWSVSGGWGYTTFARETGWSSDGVASLRYTTTNAAYSGASTGLTIPVTPGLAYSIAVVFNTLSTTTTHAAKPAWYDSGGAYLSLAGNTASSSALGVERHVIENMIAPTGAAFIVVVAEVAQAQGDYDGYIDAVMVVQAATVPASFYAGTPPNTTAVIGRATQKQTTGTVALVASIVKVTAGAVARTLTALAGSTAVVVRQAARNLTTTATATASVARATSRTLLTTATTTATATRIAARTVTAAATALAGVARQSARRFTATTVVTAALTVSRAYLRTLTAATTGVATLTVSRAYLRAITATQAVTGSVSKLAARALTAGASSTANLRRATTRAFLATTGLLPALTRQAARSVTAPAGSTATRSTITNRTTVATLTTSAGVRRGVSRTASTSTGSLASAALLVTYGTLLAPIGLIEGAGSNSTIDAATSVTGVTERDSTASGLLGGTSTASLIGG